MNPRNIDSEDFLCLNKINYINYGKKYKRQYKIKKR